MTVEAEQRLTEGWEAVQRGDFAAAREGWRALSREEVPEEGEERYRRLGRALRVDPVALVVAGISVAAWLLVLTLAYFI